MTETTVAPPKGSLAEEAMELLMLESAYEEDVPCEAVEGCEEPPVWVATSHPCGCKGNICDKHKQIAEANRENPLYLLGMVVLTCQVCNAHTDDITFRPL